MPVEKSAGAVVFYRGEGGKIEYLVLQGHRGEKRWGFPKGMIEPGEKLEETALREIKEEAGLQNPILIDGFKETIRYFMKVKFEYQLSRGLKMGETVLKFVTYFLAESKDKDVKLSFEHEGFEWLNYEDAMERLKPLKTMQPVLKKADEFLTQE